MKCREGREDIWFVQHEIEPISQPHFGVVQRTSPHCIASAERQQRH